MKVIVIAICLAGVTKVTAQSFPTPQNFQMELRYIHLDEWGICGGESVVGPFHCTNFQWDEPDLSETESQLVGYRIYNYSTMEEMEEIPFSEGKLIAQTVTPGCEIGGGYVGYTWVTAVYSEPDGESEPSNLAINLNGLPLAVSETESEKQAIIYSSQTKTIEIKGLEEIATVDIFGIDGRFVAASKSNSIDVNHLTTGIYIVRVATKTGKVFSDKLLIQ